MHCTFFFFFVALDNTDQCIHLGTRPAHHQLANASGRAPVSFPALYPISIYGCQVSCKSHLSLKYMNMCDSNYLYVLFVKLKLAYWLVGCLCLPDPTSPHSNVAVSDVATGHGPWRMYSIARPCFQLFVCGNLC